MEDDFAQGTTPLGALRGILGNYPFSVGLLREILQNSDDARASKQSFVLDRRTHATASLYHPNLASTQGPALLAFNDANFHAADWHSLKFAYESSKADDSSKIGKYGVGFRSLFHITDCPQIVSGNTFAMFDPLQEFTGSAGKRLDLAHTLTNNPDQLTSFSRFLDPQEHQSGFDGTIIRCPLRQVPSRISSKVITSDDIAHLFHEFVYEEIDISLLFLQHIQQIDIYDIDKHGRSICIAELSISRSPRSQYGPVAETYTATVNITIENDQDERIWRIIHCPFKQEEAIQLLSEGSPDFTTRILKEHKLLPTVGIAMPLPITPNDIGSGRLFTFLPLPLPTGFPVHLHAYFALTQSRQNLRNSREIGLGSDDHVLIEWNKLLFNHYIPHAWKLLLAVLSEKDTINDIFMAWPPEQRSPATSGENVYWEFLPKNILNVTVLAKSSIWPVYQIGNSISSPPEFQPLDALITADPTIPDNVLYALTSVGLKFTRPPQYIVDLIKNSPHENLRVLTPNEARRSLLTHLDELHAATNDVIHVILDYLLSTKDVRNIIGLPLIKLPNGQKATLLTVGETTTTFTLLNRTEYDVFGACDDNAIPLHFLPTSVAETLRIHGPDVVNVTNLAVPRIIEYLTLYHTKLGLDLSLARTDPVARKWLSSFWIWQNTYPYKAELYSNISGLFLLPSSRGLRKADLPLFRSRGEHPVTVNHLTSLGVPFLDAELPEPAQNILMQYGLLKSITDIHALLDSLPSSFDTLHLSREACMAILGHISNHISGSCSLRGSLGDERVQRLRSLPVFPVVQFSTSTHTLTPLWAAIPPSCTIRAVRTPTFLPSVPNFIFIQLPPSTSLFVLDYIEPSYPKFLSDVEVLSLTVDHFVDQPDHVHAAALSYMAQNRAYIPPRITETLQQTSFVATQAGSRKRPIDVVDPKSPIASLYSDNLERKIRCSTPSDDAIIQSMRSLKLMQDTLTIDIVEEAIKTISLASTSRKSLDLSKYLLSIMTTTSLDYSQLHISPHQRWLPTDQGLRGFEECRDATTFSRHLFDRVLAVLDPSLTIPTSLKHSLGWNKPLPMQILVDQLDQTLDSPGDIFTVVFEIIKEIGSRTFSNEELVSLQDITRSRKWVPTIDRQLSVTTNAVFSQPPVGSGFSQVCHTDQHTREFLRRMGCTDRPSTAAILSKLQASREQIPSLHVVDVALSLLRSLAPDLTAEERSRVLVPDVNCILRPFSETFFNDIGDQVRLIPPDDSFISHPLLDENLAQMLSLGRLGLKYADLAISGVEMGEKPVITVRKTLGQYTAKQFTTEFLANAADANATEFTLLVNNFCGDTETDIRALSPVMAKFCTSPSLVVHNNATFTDADFTGICRTSVGGKQNRPETIGQFGLGALTMFHFTELAIIVSNTRVLFLNPSKAHLPIRDSAALLLPLEHVRKFYRSHLATIDGLFDFDISNDLPYNGTIFLLPLREGLHLEAESILRNTWTTEEIERDIIQSFSESASNSLLFTSMERIAGFVRDSNGRQTLCWSFDAERTPHSVDSHNGMSISHIAITDHSTSVSAWKVATITVPETEIPEELHSLATELRLRLPPVAGLALLLDDLPQRHEKFKFFSTLPLAIPNSLPVHVMASFILASDRRQIRMDDYAGPETRYNKWLLSEIIPSLYYFLLEQMLRLGDERGNAEWWPRHRSNDDPYSRSIVDAFYSEKLLNCDRKLFRSSYYPEMSLPANEVVLSGEEPQSIKNALADLEPYNIVELPKAVYRLATDLERSRIAKVTPAFLRREILQDSSSITQSNLETIKDVIVYLSTSDSGGAPSNLFELPILPLEDGSFGTFGNPLDATQYFVWAPRTTAARHNFPSQYFVHPQLRVPNLLKLGLNVTPLDSVGIRRFIEEILPTSSPVNSLSSQTKEWISEFWNTWEEYTRLDLSSQGISDFPLVPTIHTDIFVSLSQCRDGTALLVGGNKDTDEFLRAALHRLGLIVVRLDEEPTPESLRRILAEGYPPLRFENVLSALSLQQPLDARFHNLDDELLTVFASWARRNIQSVPDNLLSIAQQLPIWRSVKNGLPRKLRPASEVYMLPDGPGFDINAAGSFMRVLVANYGALKSLGKTALTFEEVGNMLELPGVMQDSDLRLYNAFLRVWVPGLPPSYTQPIPLPNSNRTITPSNELYARTPLFQAVFGDDSDHFIAPELAEVENLFYKHGLRHEGQLDVPIFRICAEAISNMPHEEQAIRAAVLFDAYCVSLPLHVDPDDQEVWHELDQISFIPRNMSAERRREESGVGLPIPVHIANLPDIVPPLNLVRKEFEAVAWTQRALFLNQPHQRVLIAHPSLGQPDIADVIQHLQALASLSITASRQQRRLFLDDLIQTYTFLANNATSETSQEISNQISNRNLFLNVDDPDTEVWQWDNRDHLVFETQDTEGSFRYVRNFLLPFEKLLRVAGVLEVYHPQYTSDHSINSDTLKLEAIRKGFDALRQQNSLTDLVFITGNTDDSESGSGDQPALVAHRSFLAVVSEYFSDSFCGGFIESRAASPEDPIQFPVPDNTRPCIQSILDYIYTGTHSVTDAPLELLLEIMQLSGYWRITDLFEAMQREIVDRRLINPLTLDSIRETAEQSNAQNLLRSCTDYEDINAAFILKVRQSAEVDRDEGEDV